jgi:hypothetical protein
MNQEYWRKAKYTSRLIGTHKRFLILRLMQRLLNKFYMVKKEVKLKSLAEVYL